MRTTLDIDDQILEYSRDRARAEGVSIGKALSEYAREGLEATTVHGEGEFLVRSEQGILTVVSGHRISNEDVERALDDDE